MRYAVILTRQKKKQMTTVQVPFLSIEDAIHYESNIRANDPKVTHTELIPLFNETPIPS